MFTWLTIALAAVSPAGGFGAADLADARCILVVGAAAKVQIDPAKKLQVQMSSVYYVGKINGRNPSTDLEALIRAAVAAPGIQMADEAKRCGVELETLGTSMQKVGKSLSASGM